MTVHAPHCRRSHPIFVPVSFRSSRRNWSSVVWLGISLRYATPLTLSATVECRGSASTASGSCASVTVGIRTEESAPVAIAPPFRNARRETDSSDLSRSSFATIYPRRDDDVSENEIWKGKRGDYKPNGRGGQSIIASCSRNRAQFVRPFRGCGRCTNGARPRPAPAGYPD